MEQSELILLFPTLFMLHEMEEILWFPKFIKNNQKKYSNSNFFQKIITVSSFRFNLIVFQQLILLLTFTALSCYFHWYSFYMALMLAFIYHIIGHIIQMLVLKRYIPGVISGIFSCICIIFLGKDWSLNWFETFLYSIIALMLIVFNLVAMYAITKKVA